jgi:hypothetical protein
MRKLRVVSYDTWGNERDGFEVNNLYEVGVVEISDRLLEKYTCKQIAKYIHGKRGHNTWSPYNLNAANYLACDLRRVNVIDYYPFIELEDKKTGMPVGRIEVEGND